MDQIRACIGRRVRAGRKKHCDTLRRDWAGLWRRRFTRNRTRTVFRRKRGPAPTGDVFVWSSSGESRKTPITTTKQHSALLYVRFSSHDYYRFSARACCPTTVFGTNASRPSPTVGCDDGVGGGRYLRYTTRSRRVGDGGGGCDCGGVTRARRRWPVECYLVLSAARDGQVKVWLSWRHVHRWCTGTGGDISGSRYYIYTRMCVQVYLGHTAFSVMRFRVVYARHFVGSTKGLNEQSCTAGKRGIHHNGGGYTTPRYRGK